MYYGQSAPANVPIAARGVDIRAHLFVGGIMDSQSSVCMQIWRRFGERDKSDEKEADENQTKVDATPPDYSSVCLKSQRQRGKKRA